MRIDKTSLSVAKSLEGSSYVVFLCWMTSLNSLKFILKKGLFKEGLCKEDVLSR